MSAIHRARHAIRIYLARRRRQAAAERHAAMCAAYFELKTLTGE